MTQGAINNEELAAFVTSTLNAIAAGVDAAKAEGYDFELPKSITFEVAVKATHSAEVGGGLKIKVFSAEGRKVSEDEEVSRINFTVNASKQFSQGTLDTTNLRAGVV